MTLRRIGWPLAAWYWRASFQADSTASEPPETKNARLMLGRRELGEPRGELGRGRVRERPVRVVRQLPHLLERGLAELLAVRVADLHREQPAEHVQVALAVRVEEVRALAALDDRDLAVPVGAHRREVQPEVILRLALQLRVHARVDRHVRPSVDLPGNASTRRAATVLPWPADRPRASTLAAADHGPRGGGGCGRRRPAGARRTARRAARAPGSRAVGVPRRRCSRAVAARTGCRVRIVPPLAPGAVPAAGIDLVELRGDDAGALIASGRLALIEESHRERPGRRPGPAARRRARRRRRPARRAVPVEPATAARPPLGVRHAAADEPARAVLAPRGDARRPARLAARARDRGPLPRQSAIPSSSTATSWLPRAGWSRRPVRCCTSTPMPPPSARSSGAV